LKAKIENIHIRGVSRTNQAYIENQFGDIFKATNFYDLLEQTNELKKRLGKLDAFKSVTALIDSSESIYINYKKKKS
jgi:hypothetical protein